MHEIGIGRRFRIVAEIAPPEPLVRRGDRLDYIPITGGTVEGAVTGVIVPGGGDRCLTRTDGVVEVEARYVVRTAAGGLVDVHNVGVLREATADEPEYFLTTPRFRTVAPELGWLTASVFVGRARVHGDRVVIDVVELLDGG